MILILTSFLAGVTSVFAPCVLPILPVILGSGLSGSQSQAKVIIISCLFSIFVFTILLKVSTLFIDIPHQTWMTLSGVIITLYALTLLLPTLRERISGYVGLSSIHPIETHSKWSTIILGSSLGLVFNSCSPTYILIIATIFPSSFTQGVLYTIVYCLGFGAMLWLVSIAGFKIITSFKLLANPHGWFKKILGVLLLLVGILMISGHITLLQTRLVGINLLSISGY